MRMAFPELPDTWIRSRLDREATVKARIGWKALTASEYVDDGVIFLSTPNIKSSDIDFKNTNFITRDRYDESPELKLEVGDVLIAKDGSTLGITNVVRHLPGPATVNGSIAVVRPTGMDSRFLRYALASDLTQGMIGAVRAGMGVPHLFQADLRKFAIPRPPRGTQAAVADFLDRETARIDALVDKKQRLIDLLEEKRVATITQAVTKGLDPTVPMKDSRVPWTDEIPEHWSAAHIVRLARLGSGHTPSRSRPEWWVDQTVPWITTGEVSQMRGDRIEYVSDTREMISELGLANSSAELCEAGTVVLSRTASAGFSAIMGQDMATSQDYVTWTCGPELEPRYLLLCLRAMRSDLLGRLAQGSTHKTIYMPDIVSIRVPVPPIVEQRAIVDSFWEDARAIDGVVDHLTAQIPLLAEYREAFITAAVTGEIDVDTFNRDQHMEEVAG